MSRLNREELARSILKTLVATDIKLDLSERPFSEGYHMSLRGGRGRPYHRAERTQKGMINRAVELRKSGVDCNECAKVLLTDLKKTYGWRGVPETLAEINAVIRAINFVYFTWEFDEEYMYVMAYGASRYCWEIRWPQVSFLMTQSPEQTLEKMVSGDLIKETCDFMRVEIPRIDENGLAHVGGRAIPSEVIPI